MNLLRYSLSLLAAGLAIASVSSRAFGEDEKTVVLTGNDQMKYDVTSFEVNAGQKVTVTMKNAGMVPKIAMGHNFVLLKPGTNVMAFAAAGAAHSNEGYIAPDQQDKIIAQTKLTGPGESDSVTFTAPAAGTYDYLCTFPGHAAAGMRGVMTVK